MCTVTINIDETQVRKVNPALTSIESITRWAQQLVDACIADLAEAEEYPLPEGLKPYTIEELHERIRASEADFAAGRVYDFDEAMDMIEKELDEELEMAEAV